MEGKKTNFSAGSDEPSQSVEEIMQIVQEAWTPVEGAKGGGQQSAEAETEGDSEDVDNSGDFVSHMCATRQMSL